MIKYSTEYLIRNEYSVDWEKISSDPDDFLSLIEIRLFRKRIDWDKYITTHRSQLNDEMLEIASKYFTHKTYSLIALFNVCSEAFLENHIDEYKDSYNFRIIIGSCNVSEEFLLKYKSYWEGIPEVRTLFESSQYIDLRSADYSNLLLVLETL